MNPEQTRQLLLNLKKIAVALQNIDQTLDQINTLLTELTTKDPKGNRTLWIQT